MPVHVLQVLQLLAHRSQLPIAAKTVLTGLKKTHNLLRANNQLKTKVQTLKEGVSSLRNTITELISVSFIYLCLFAINNLPIFLTCVIPLLYVYIKSYSLACLPCIFFHPLSKIMTCKYFLLSCFTSAFSRQGNGDRR